MSTRANIFVDYAGTRTQFYHHMDGYPEGVGRDLFWKLKVSVEDEKNQPDLIYCNFDKRLRDSGYELEGEVYIHGDIEYLYYVDIDTKTITYSEAHLLGNRKQAERARALESAERGELDLIKQLHLEKEV